MDNLGSAAVKGELNLVRVTIWAMEFRKSAQHSFEIVRSRGIKTLGEEFSS